MSNKVKLTINIQWRNEMGLIIEEVVIEDGEVCFGFPLSEKIQKALERFLGMAVINPFPGDDIVIRTERRIVHD